MALAHKDTTCTSCGDSIASGARITVKKHDKKPAELLCFRCHPETEAVRLKTKSITSTEINPSYRKKPNFFGKRK